MTNEFVSNKKRTALVKSLNSIRDKMHDHLLSVTHMKNRREEEADLRWSSIFLERVLVNLKKPNKED